MSRVYKKYTSTDKINHILDGLTYPDGIAAYCRNKGITDTIFYKWKNQIIKNAANVFEGIKNKDYLENKYTAIINKKDNIISALAEENIMLKKKDGIY